MPNNNETCVIFSDIHGRDIAPIKDMFYESKVDKGICLGDFDQPKIALEVKDLQKEHELYVVPGNHDHAYVCGKWIESGTIEKQNETYISLKQKWDDNTEATKYIKDMLDSNDNSDMSTRRKVLDINGLCAVAIHGGFASCDSEPRDLWSRCKNESKCMENFEAMKRTGVDILIRGHDHLPQYIRNDDKKGFKDYSEELFADFSKDKIKDNVYYASKVNILTKHERQHIINPGPFYDGHYAVIHPKQDSETDNALQFCNIL